MRFINEIKTTVKEVLAREIRLKVTGDRFYDRSQEVFLPYKSCDLQQQKHVGIL